MAKEHLHFQIPYQTVLHGGFKDGDIAWFPEGGQSSASFTAHYIMLSLLALSPSPGYMIAATCLRNAPMTAADDTLGTRQGSTHHTTALIDGHTSTPTRLQSSGKQTSRVPT